MEQYTEVFSDWLREKIGVVRYNTFLKSLVEGRVEEFTELLGEFLMSSLSVRDVMGDKKPSERFYHGFFVGLTASLAYQFGYDYSSNKESGLGFYDVGLIPLSKDKSVGLVLEFKKTTSDENMDYEAKKALKQIDQMRYETSFKNHPHVKRILKVGLAFCDKCVRSAYKTTDLYPKSGAQQTESEIHLSQEYHCSDDIYDSGDNSQSSQEKIVTPSGVSVGKSGDTQKKSEHLGNSTVAPVTDAKKPSKKRSRDDASGSDNDSSNISSSQVVVMDSTKDAEPPSPKRQKTGELVVSPVSAVILSKEGFFASSEEGVHAKLPSSSSSEDVVMADTNVTQPNKPNKPN